MSTRRAEEKIAKSSYPRARPWPGTTTADTGGITRATTPSGAWSSASPSAPIPCMTRVGAPVVSAAQPTRIARRTGAFVGSSPALALTSSHKHAAADNLIRCRVCYVRRAYRRAVAPRPSARSSAEALVPAAAGGRCLRALSHRNRQTRRPLRRPACVCPPHPGACRAGEIDALEDERAEIEWLWPGARSRASKRGAGRFLRLLHETDGQQGVFLNVAPLVV